MPQFQYISRKDMEPRPGVRYATTYYKQSQREYTLLRAHVYGVAAEIAAVCDSDLDMFAWATSPLKEFRKSDRRGHYSLYEIVTDMVNQFSLQRDVPSGILGRWQRLFAGTRWDIEMVSGVPARPTQYLELFDGA